MSDWKEYTNNRLIKKHADGFYVIKDKDMPDFIPFFCGLCESIMTSSYDEESHKKFGCCDNCANRVIYPRLEEWKNGWRPSREDVTT